MWHAPSCVASFDSRPFPWWVDRKAAIIPLLSCSKLFGFRLLPWRVDQSTMDLNPDSLVLLVLVITYWCDMCLAIEPSPQHSCLSSRSNFLIHVYHHGIRIEKIMRPTPCFPCLALFSFRCLPCHVNQRITESSPLLLLFHFRQPLLITVMCGLMEHGTRFPITP